MDIHRALILCSISLLCASACSTRIIPDPSFKNHAASVSSPGELLIPTGRQDDGKEFSYSADNQRIAVYARDIAKAIIAERSNRAKECSGGQSSQAYKQKILLFIHGGLNNIADSTKRVNEVNGRIREEAPCLYPIFLNWDSGLAGSLLDHWFLVRQGMEWPKTGWLASPFELAADFGRGLVRAPLTWGGQLMSDASSLPVYSSPDEKMVNDVYKRARLPDSPFHTRIEKGNLETPRPDGVQYSAGHKFASRIALVEGVVWYVATLIPQYVISPLVDGFGTPAWDNQLRRASTIFDRPGDFDTRLKPGTSPNEIIGPTKRNGALSIFMAALRDELKTASLDNFEFVVVAHSMGTIIANKIITEYPELPYSRIVYMAGADSIRNTYDAVIPHLLRTGAADTKFYNLTLHPDREKVEMNAIGFAPRGSLLVWIDSYFTTPPTQLDRTVGAWDNIIPTINLIPDQVRNRFFIKSFDYDTTGCIRKHGDFGDEKFWTEDFWTPGKLTNGCSEPPDPSLWLLIFPAFR
jgi:pimeloyl-ACP methyl ester carboxylesterase